ncbi:MAG: ABC transporter permease [Elusimicrobia bacterium]|nr:ABC transporter permease [Elusimicrobiota bacterium]
MINKTLRGFIRKELSQALRDPRMRMVLFVMPAVQMMVFGFALNTEVRNVRLAGLYRPDDFVARRVMERALASKWFVPASISGADPFCWVQSGQAEAVLVAPADGLTKTLGRRDAQVQLLVDATNLLRARSIERYFAAVLAETAANERAGAGPPPRFSFAIRVLYNPAMRSSLFLAPSVVGLILCIVTIFMTAMSLAREREIGTFELLVSAPIRNWEIIAGKTVPFFFLGMVDVFLLLAAGVFIFRVPVRGPLWELALSSVVFVCATVSIGTLISTLARNQQQALMGSFLFLFPAMLLSGLVFPLENMPAALEAITYLNPLRYFIALQRIILLKGGDPLAFWPNLLAMALLGAAVAWSAVKRFHQTLN